MRSRPRPRSRPRRPQETEEFIAVIRACIEGGDPLVFRDASRNWLGAWRGRSGGPPGRGKSYLELANAANILGGHYAFSGEIDTMKQKVRDRAPLCRARARLVASLRRSRAGLAGPRAPPRPARRAVCSFAGAPRAAWERKADGARSRARARARVCSRATQDMDNLVMYTAAAEKALKKGI